MGVTFINIPGTPGLDYVQDATLANVTILWVKREGLGQTEVSTTPSGRQFKYYSGDGKIQFDTNIPFYSNPSNDIKENVFILYLEP